MSCQGLAFPFKVTKTWLANFLPLSIYSPLSSETAIQDVLKYLTLCVLWWKHEWCNLFCLKQIYIFINFYIKKESMKTYYRQCNMILLKLFFFWWWWWCAGVIFLDRFTENWGGEKWHHEGRVLFSITCSKIFQVYFEIKILESNGFLNLGLVYQLWNNIFLLEIAN